MSHPDSSSSPSNVPPAPGDELRTLDAEAIPSSWLRNVLNEPPGEVVPLPNALTRPTSSDSTDADGEEAKLSLGDIPPPPSVLPVASAASAAPAPLASPPTPIPASGVASRITRPLVPAKNLYGEEVPGFEVGEIVGRGGMGVVYKARQVELNRVVALKMVLGGVKARPQELARFLAEAALVASIKHPNVVTVYDYGEYNGKPFMALEFLPGGTLTDFTTQTRPNAEQSATVMAKIARGVAAAHTEQIVHRDLKPQNVLFDTKGNPKVVDFGLARRAAGTGLTATEAVMGTPSYMSPEQASGKTKFAGPQSDVWSLGVMLYEMLTGSRPFGQGSFHEIMARVIRGEFELPSATGIRIPRDLEQIVLKCLEPLPTDRYPTATELAEDLERYIAGESVTARPAGPAERAAKWIRRRPSVAAAYALGTVTVALTLFAGTTAYLWREAEAGRTSAAAGQAQAEQAQGVAEIARTEAEQARQTALHARDQLAIEKRQTESALSREQVARQAEADARRSAEVATKREQLANSRLTDLQYGRTVDLAHRAFLANDVARAAQLLASAPADRRGWEWAYVQKLVQPTGLRMAPKAGPVASARFSADAGSLLTAHGDGTARLWEPFTGAAGVILKGHQGQVLDAIFVPNATTGISTSAVTAGEDGTIRLWNLATAELLQTLMMTVDSEGSNAVPPKVLSLAVNPKGTAVVAGDDRGGIASWELPSGRAGRTLASGLGPIQAIAFSPAGRIAAAGNQILIGGGKGNNTLASPAKVNAVAWRDESTLASACADGVIRIWEVDAARLVAAFPADPVNVTAVAYVDANRLLTAGYDRTLGVWDTATGQRQLQLRGHTDAIWSATVSGRIVASTSFDGTIQIQSLDRAGEWESRRPVEGPVTRLTLSSTGQLLVGSRNGDLAALPAPSNPLARTVEPPASRKATPGSSAVLALKDSGQAAFALPTDGTMVSWSTKNGETRGVRKSPFPMATAAAFAPGSEFRLALASTERKLMLYLTPDAEPIWTAPLPQRVGAIAFSPDGKRLALAPAEGETGPLMLLDSATGREIAQLAKELTGTRTLAFSPDGQRLAAGLVDTTARIWDLTRGGGKELHQLRGHGAKVEAIAWTADGRRLATGSPDGTIKLWDTSMGDELLALPAPDGDTTALLLHPDGTTLFAGGARGEVRCFRTTK